jgi:hypothetical protein
MTTNHPALNAHDFFPSAATAAALPPTAGGTQLDTEETSGKLGKSFTYRDFLASGVKGDILRAETIYWMWDNLESANRHGQLLQCRSHAHFMIHKTSKEIRVASSACGLRWCPLCIRTRRYIITQSVKGWLKKREKPKFLTFTMKHRTAPLAVQIDNLYKYFRAIRKHKAFKNSIKGGIWFFQVKRSKDDLHWHPHIHCLCEGKFVHHAELVKAWETITHGSKVVDVRAVKDIEKSAEYVARYAAAPCRLLNYDTDKALECVQALHGRRICGTFGTAKGVSLRPKACEDVEDWQELDSFFNIQNNVDNSEIAKGIYRAWITNKPYDGELPAPPPKIDEAYKKEIDRPRTFVQSFFEFLSGNQHQER